MKGVLRDKEKALHKRLAPCAGKKVDVQALFAEGGRGSANTNRARITPKGVKEHESSSGSTKFAG